jgi:hypothetical protein
VKRLLAALLLPAALAGCTDDLDGEQRIGRVEGWALAAGSPTGPPVHCIEQARVRGHSVRDPRTIDFNMDDGSLLRNRLPFACPGLIGNARITYRTALPRLCSTDTIVLANEQGAAAGSCGLGMFQPIAISSQPAARQ